MELTPSYLILLEHASLDIKVWKTIDILKDTIPTLIQIHHSHLIT